MIDAGTYKTGSWTEMRNKFCPPDRIIMCCVRRIWYYNNIFYYYIEYVQRTVTFRSGHGFAYDGKLVVNNIDTYACKKKDPHNLLQNLWLRLYIAMILYYPRVHVIAYTTRRRHGRKPSR
jgi:hypothetical protein